MTDSQAGVFGIVFTAVIAAVVFYLWRWSSRPSKNRPEKRRYCTRCGTAAEPVYYSAGSGLVELFLILLFVVPAIFYHFWRRSKEYWGCPRCKSAEIIPLDSPVAQGRIQPALSRDSVADRLATIGYKLPGGGL